MNNNFCLVPWSISGRLPPLHQSRPQTPPKKRGSGDIWLISLASLTLITFWREISLCQSHCRKHNLWSQHRKVLATLARWHSTFLARKLVYQSSTMHTASYEFLMKPKESAGCRQTLSSRLAMGSGDETTTTLPWVCFTSLLRPYMNN